MKLARKSQDKSVKRGYLDGQMLIAMPTMGDERFARSLIYICAHSSEGAMGIVVNQPAGNISFRDLLVQLDVIPAGELIELPAQAGGVKVLRGGPVETSRGFVLHSSDFFIENSTLPIDEGICLTATLDILKAIARGNGLPLQIEERVGFHQAAHPGVGAVVALYLGGVAATVEAFAQVAPQVLALGVFLF